MKTPLLQSFRGIRQEQNAGEIKAKLSEQKDEEMYKRRKTDFEPVFGFQKAHLSFTRFPVRGKSSVDNKLSFALMAVNLRKYTDKTTEIKNFVEQKWTKSLLFSDSVHF